MIRRTLAILVCATPALAGEAYEWVDYSCTKRLVLVGDSTFRYYDEPEFPDGYFECQLTDDVRFKTTFTIWCGEARGFKIELLDNDRLIIMDDVMTRGTPDTVSCKDDEAW